VIGALLPKSRDFSQRLSKLRKMKSSVLTGGAFLHKSAQFLTKTFAFL
jgi:hypothetical protein